jgi:hypothetical protein
MKVIVTTSAKDSADTAGDVVFASTRVLEGTIAQSSIRRRLTWPGAAAV